jgi:hypothetical protein
MRAVFEYAAAMVIVGPVALVFFASMLADLALQGLRWPVLLLREVCGAWLRRMAGN